ncbi:hypothetical protein PHYBLDRAFT_176275 [Phycomyces blakesleeanus NRRL 1555(-)]|uniref:Uncharacterized protein n=1 Tax=Phycomyces blakesleeanus (strain ATCC 8743b / DSM 1359 / FGSC 10004 / NBRC 33097 / NRRL 1555) TaxID=763407 RepID=A0A162W8J8_PHYB8|nr:hypothetical protein PHYBLDRAFT_176275 [Phycomyces blakesleeanus NRRL 1555(-)]OAD65365.1 hypothetical protein PHYBLDRAFT_176275 [Phycomyces blakesleeanus NRRL 1555(-)]|eukprot:XP_018283405.1 hypothetical protein PHYBLDRAFT_176275 [Phycomyces blakesleeanus NRRL 1555(-)]
MIVVFQFLKAFFLYYIWLLECIYCLTSVGVTIMTSSPKSALGLPTKLAPYRSDTVYPANALVNSSTEEIKLLALDVVVKWNKCRKLRVRELMYEKTRKCHQARFYISDKNVCLAQKDTKLCYCEATIFIKQYVNNPEVVLICMTKDHTNYVSGDASEIRTLLLPSEAIKIIEDQLKGGRTCRNTRVSVLKQIEEWGIDIRKSNYKDIYNKMRKMCEEYYKIEVI